MHLASLVVAAAAAHAPLGRPRAAPARLATARMMAPPGASPAGAAPARVNRDAQAPLFRLWMKREGVKSEALDLSTFGGRGRGCTALRDIEAGELLVSLPRDAAMDLALLTEVPVPPSLCSAELFVSLPWFAQLALWVLAEEAKGSSSRWAAYIELLPLQGRPLDTPYRWAAPELEALGYAPLLESVREQRQLFAEMHAAVAGSAEGSELGLEAFACACEAVLSRAFPTAGLNGRDGRERGPAADAAEGAEGGGGGGLLGALAGGLAAATGQGRPPLLPPDRHFALLPAIDCLNHKSGHSGVFAYDPRSRALELRTADAAAAGSQAFLEYGKKGNDELLLLYGFVEAANPYDEATSTGLSAWLRSGHPPTRSLSEEEWGRRMGALKQAGLDGALDGCTLSGAGAQPELLEAAAIACGSEAAALGALGGFCRHAAKELPTRQEARAGSGSGARLATVSSFVACKRATLKAAEAAIRAQADRLKRR